jgi:predicted aspartyl protease/Tfp pilus assembly protein PilF
MARSIEFRSILRGKAQGSAPLIAIILLLIGCPGRAWADEDCTLKVIAELPMSPHPADEPVVPILVDDKPRNVLIDTGGFWSIINPSIAAGYATRTAEVSGTLGLDGTPLKKAVRIPSVQLGVLKVANVDFFITPYEDGAIDGTLGANWLQKMDVEIDPVQKKVFLLSNKHCDGVVFHWPHQDEARIPVRVVPVEGHVTLLVKLAGEEIRATVDTGAPETALSLRAAARLFDLKPGSPGVEPIDTHANDPDGKHQSYRYQFKSLELDGITFKNPSVMLAPMAPNVPELIIGMHQLRGLHLYFAYKERMLYVSTARGDIAARRAEGGAAAAAIVQDTDPLDRANAQDLLHKAEGALRVRDLDTAAADIDRALLIDGSNVPARVMQAKLYAMKGDRLRALDTVNEALRLDPKSAEAYFERSNLRHAAGDYEGAFADADQLVMLAPKSPLALNERCWLGAITGRLDGALADCNAALAIAPHSAPILDSRGYVHLKAGRLDQAIADYGAALKEKPDEVSSLYGRGLAERQNGDKRSGDTDIAAAQKLDPAIAEHFGI